MPNDNLPAGTPGDTRDKVTAEREQAGRARDLPDLTPQQQDAVDTSYSLLVDLEDVLAQQDIKSNLTQLKTAAVRLSEIADSLRRSIAGLQRVGRAVSGAAQAVGALADLLGKASSAGML
jgi:hypothetical protein